MVENSEDLFYCSLHGWINPMQGGKTHRLVSMLNNKQQPVNISILKFLWFF